MIRGAASHDGESFVEVLARVRTWLDALGDTGTVVAITHASIIRAAVFHVLNASPAAFSRIEVAPLPVVELRRSTRGWAWWPTQS
ncbi:histidine phosphatase family protein [Paraburkholderia sp. IMGN_8]|uniref:histidine phosphatase family protein n=1 Tax=Paraburkholderia sp. IMGN_8 TaxID=3136564 RepID=UPI0031019325